MPETELTQQEADALIALKKRRIDASPPRFMPHQ